MKQTTIRVPNRVRQRLWRLRRGRETHSDVIEEALDLLEMKRLAEEEREAVETFEEADA